MHLPAFTWQAKWTIVFKHVPLVLFTLFTPSEFDIYLNKAELYQIDSVSINRRQIKAQGRNESQIWFRFEDLCIGPRAAADYMELASQFDEIIVSHIPCLSGEAFEHIKARGTEDGALGSGQTGDRLVSLAINDDAVRRFISLVDECYDQRVRLILQAEVPLEQLYQAGTLLFEFRRTQKSPNGNGPSWVLGVLKSKVVL